MKNISKVPSSGLCVSCSACKAVCALGAISCEFCDGMFRPVIDKDKCVNCGRCQKVCPSCLSFSPKYRRGPFKCAFSAYSKDVALRHNSASGGVVSQIICSLLDKGTYKRAYVCEFENFRGEIARLMPVVDRNGVLAAAKSKYIPVSIEEVVCAIRSRRISGSIVVCTPCQLLAIKRAMRMFHVNDNDVLFIGLFCERMFNYNIYDHYMQEYGDFEVLHFKDKNPNGWPGDTLLIQNGRPLSIDRKVRMSLKQRYPVGRCEQCYDKLNNGADISAGDCYDFNNPFSEEERSKGLSSVIIRTNKGKLAIGLCVNDMVIVPTSLKVIEMSQHVYQPSIAFRILMKIRNLAGRVIRRIKSCKI